MINEQELLENIKEKSIFELKDLSDEQYKELFDATILAIDNTLESGDSLDIDDFGLFSRKKRGAVSVSIFKTADRLYDRINRKK